MYKESFKDKSELIDEINKILENGDIKNLINETDLSYLPFHLRKCIDLINKRDFISFFVWHYFNLKLKM